MPFVPACRNGRRGRLKIFCEQSRGGSSPFTGTRASPRTALSSRRSFLLQRKRHARLVYCRTTPCSVAVLCKPSQPQITHGFAVVSTGHTLISVASHAAPSRLAFASKQALKRLYEVGRGTKDDRYDNEKCAQFAAKLIFSASPFMPLCLTDKIEKRLRSPARARLSFCAKR